jgi:hypothetical protein
LNGRSFFAGTHGIMEDGPALGVETEVEVGAIVSEEFEHFSFGWFRGGLGGSRGRRREGEDL